VAPLLAGFSVVARNLDAAGDSHHLRNQAKVQPAEVGTTDFESKSDGFEEVLGSDPVHNLPLRRVAPSYSASVIAFTGSTDSAGIDID
jgi:hypothetical protein